MVLLPWSRRRPKGHFYAEMIGSIWSKSTCDFFNIKAVWHARAAMLDASFYEEKQFK
jgi:hypothetical protein